MYSRKHSSDFLFLLVVFGFFAALAFSCAALGAGFYRSCVSRSAKLGSVDLAVSYIAEKLRQTDASEGFALKEFGDSDALTLRSRYQGESYVTLIYTWEGSLRELFARESTALSPEMGSALAELSSLSVTRISDTLYRLQAENSQGSQAVLYVSPHTLY